MPVELRSENGPKVSESKGGGAAAAVRESPASPVVGGLHYGPETYILVADAGRLYRQVRQNGTLRRVTAILFPWNYAFPIQGSLMRWVCPVDTCDLESGKLLGLSKHWRSKHKSTAFRDNADRTITEVGTCDVSNVVEQAPNVVAANSAAGSRSKRKRKTPASQPRSPAKRTRQANAASNDGVDEDEDDEDNDRHRPVDEDGGQNTSGNPRATEKALDDTVASSGEATEGSYDVQYSSLMTQADPLNHYTQAAFVDYCSFLGQKLGREGNIYVFPPAFWETRNRAGRLDSLLSSKPCKSLVFLFDNSTHWYGIFVNLASDSLVLAVLDPSGAHHVYKAARIVDLLTSHGLLRPAQIEDNHRCDPKHGLPRTPGDERGLFLIRALACFFYNPAQFFSDTSNKVPLYLGEAGMPTFAYAHTTHEAVIRTRTNLLYKRIALENVGLYLLRTKCATNDDPVKQAMVLDILSEQIFHTNRQLQASINAQTDNTELVTDENEDQNYDEAYDEANDNDCDDDYEPDQTQDQIIVEESPSIEDVPRPENGEPVLTLVVEPESSPYDTNLHTAPSGRNVKRSPEHNDTQNGFDRNFTLPQSAPNRGQLQSPHFPPIQVPPIPVFPFTPTQAAVAQMEVDSNGEPAYFDQGTSMAANEVTPINNQPRDTINSAFVPR